MIFRVVAGKQFEKDLGELPTPARTEMWRLIAGLRKRPLASGLGFTVNELRHSSRRGVRVAHFWRDQYRLLYEVDGELLILMGVGKKPGFHRRLDRLRARG